MFNENMINIENKIKLCDCCKRHSTEGHDIELRQLNKTMNGKKYGALNHLPSQYINPTLCYFCAKYMTLKRQHAIFEESWAAHVYTKL